MACASYTMLVCERADGCMQMGELIHLPDGRIFLCNGAQLGTMQPSLQLQTLHPILHCTNVQTFDCTAVHLVLQKTAIKWLCAIDSPGWCA